MRRLIIVKLLLSASISFAIGPGTYLVSFSANNEEKNAHPDILVQVKDRAGEIKVEVVEEGTTSESEVSVVKWSSGQISYETFDCALTLRSRDKSAKPKMFLLSGRSGTKPPGSTGFTRFSGGAMQCSAGEWSQMIFRMQLVSKQQPIAHPDDPPQEN